MPIARDSLDVVQYVNDTKIMLLENYRKLNLRQLKLGEQIYNKCMIWFFRHRAMRNELVWAIRQRVVVIYYCDPSKWNKYLVPKRR